MLGRITPLFLFFITGFACPLIAASLNEQLPGSFVKNLGQWENEILFKVDLPGSSVRFLKTGMSYAQINQLMSADKLNHNSGKKIIETECLVWNTIFNNANTNPDVVFYNESDSRKRFFKGNNKSKWLSYVPSFTSVKYKNIFHKTDVQFYEINGKIKYDIILQPGAQLKKVQLRYDGIEELKIENNGSLKITHARGTVTEHIPYSYQIINGKKEEVKVIYKIFNGNTIGFEVIGAYNKNADLVIDPFIHIWGTYLESLAQGRDIAKDNNGYIYVTGQCTDNFPVTPGVYQSTHGSPGGTFDAYITKLNHTGSTVLFTTYLGGNTLDYANGIAVSSAGDIYIAGHTMSADFPVTLNAYQQTLRGMSDAFVAKFNNNGTSLIYSTFLGGTGIYDEAFDIGVDNSGQAHVCGATVAGNFPLVNQVQGKPGPNFDQEGFVAKLDAAGGSLLFSTYIGGTSQDEVSEIEVMPNGDIYVTGFTRSTTGFPMNGYANAFGGGLADGFVAKYNSGGTRIYSTYLGGAGDDWGYAIAVNSAGEAFITGYAGPGFPTTPGVYQPAFAGTTIDAFVTKINAAGTALVFSTYYGGTNGAETGEGIAINILDEVYISGIVISTDLTGTAGAIQPSHSGTFPSHDYFVAHFTNDGKKLACGKATYMGGSTDESFFPKMVLDESGFSDTLILCGTTGATDFPTTPGTYKPTNTLMYSSLPVVYKLAVGTTVDVTRSAEICFGHNTQLTASGGVSYTWLPATGLGSSTGNPVTAGPMATTTYTVTGVDINGCIDTAVGTVIVNPLPVADAGPNQISCSGVAVQLLASGGINYSWSPTSGLSCSSCANTLATPISTTKYYVTVMDTNLCSNIDSVVVNVSPAPIADAGPNTSICNGDSTLLTATGGVSYIWNASPNLSCTNCQSTKANPTTTTVFYVTVTDANGCTGIDSVIVSLNQSLIANAGLDQTLCYGAVASLTASGGGNYSWTPSTGLSNPTASNPQASPVVSTTYIVTVSNGSCLPANDTVVVTVLPLPDVSFVAQDSSGCAPLCVNFINNTNSGVNYFWAFGNNDTSSLFEPIHCYTNQGSYSVALTVIDANGCSNTLAKNNFINVFPAPKAGFTVSPDQLTFYNSTAQITDKSVGATNWQWSFGDIANSTSTQQHPQFTYADTGSYTIQQIVSNEFGCSDTSEQSITVKAGYVIYIPNTFTPNGDGKNELFFPVGVGIDIEQYDFYIFDRWGDLIFHTNNIAKGWDGRANGGTSLAQEDTYVWKLQLTDVLGEAHKYVGHVNLIR